MFNLFQLRVANPFDFFGGFLVGFNGTFYFFQFFAGFFFPVLDTVFRCFLFQSVFAL